MRKFFKKISCLLCALVLLLVGVSCKEEDNEVKEIYCAPCTLSEIWDWNETVYQTFFLMHTSASSSLRNAVKCTVDGVEKVWGFESISEGKHVVKFYTPTGFKIQQRKVVAGKVVEEEVSYEKEAVLTINVSSNYPDIYDREYREQNGLWTDPTTLPWYQLYLNAGK